MRELKFSKAFVSVGLGCDVGKLEERAWSVRHWRQRYDEGKETAEGTIEMVVRDWGDGEGCEWGSGCRSVGLQAPALPFEGDGQREHWKGAAGGAKKKTSRGAIRGSTGLYRK